MTAHQKMQDSLEIIKNAVALLEKHGEDATALKEMLLPESKAIFGTAGLINELNYVIAAQVLSLGAKMKECPLDKEFFCTNLVLFISLYATGMATLANVEWTDEQIRDLVAESPVMKALQASEVLSESTPAAFNYSLMSSPMEAYGEAISAKLTQIAEEKGDPEIEKLGKEVKHIIAEMTSGKLPPGEGVQSLKRHIMESPLGAAFKEYMKDNPPPPSLA